MRSFLIGLALFTAAAAQAAEQAPAGLQVSDAWSRPAAAGGNGAGYFSLTNGSGAARTLVRVESPVSEKVEIHRTSMANGVMSMQRLDQGLALAPGARAEFAPGGLHVMFIGLKSAFKAGDVVPAVLVFADGGRTPVKFTVGAMPAMPHAGH